MSNKLEKWKGYIDRGLTECSSDWQLRQAKATYVLAGTLAAIGEDMAGLIQQHIKVMQEVTEKLRNISMRAR